MITLFDSTTVCPSSNVDRQEEDGPSCDVSDHIIYCLSSSPVEPTIVSVSDTDAGICFICSVAIKV